MPDTEKDNDSFESDEKPGHLSDSHESGPSKAGHLSIGGGRKLM